MKGCPENPDSKFFPIPLREKLHSVMTSFINLVLPRFCPVCRTRLQPTEETMCIGCMSKLPLTQFEDSQDNAMIRKIWPGVEVKHAVSLFYYRSLHPHHNLLMRFKYMKQAKLARDLGKLAATVLSNHGLDKEIDAIIPVPLSKRRQLERGYNQAEWLAQGIGTVYNLPVCTTLLRRKIHRNLQKHLNYKERQENVKGLYAATIPEDMRGKHFLLVDDVCTTGATLSACAKVLTEADPTAQVSVFALAWVGE